MLGLLSTVLLLVACHNPVEPEGKGNEEPEWQSMNSGLDFQIIDDLQVNPTAPAQIYAATMSNFYKTRDGGANWRPITSGLSSSYLFCAAVHPLKPNQIYCGTKLGVYASTDSGETWSSISNVARVGAVKALCVSENGTIWAGTDKGLFRSVDDGATWSFANVGQYYRVHAIAAQPGRPEIVLFSVRHLGNFVTVDNGENWLSFNGNVFSDFGSIDHALQFLYEPHAGEWWMTTVGFDLYHAPDFNNSWTEVKGDLADHNVVSIACAKAPPARIWAATVQNGVYQTCDQGQTWAAIGKEPPAADISVLRFSPPAILYVATRGAGVWRLSGF
ncbi:hypothetical protein JW992_14705 [candidate division KSB1 bacterium]|nr:hypothetical protein [candidate division KSB1 bacterium]